jgi:tight adherence protein B
VGGVNLGVLVVRLLVLGAGSLTAIGLGRRWATRRAALARIGAPPGRPSRRRVAPVPGWLERAVRSADLPADAARVTVVWVCAVVLAAVVGLVAGGVSLAVLASVAVVVAGAAGLYAARHRRSARSDAALPAALELMARALRSGASLPQAVGAAARSCAAPLDAELEAVATEVDAGRPLVDALDRWAARCPTSSVELAVAALGLAATTGGTPARAVDGVASTLRERHALAREVRALSSQARASAIVIAAAPLAFAVLAGAADGRTSRFLLRTGAGLACLAAGLALDGLAAVWMLRITRAVAA